MSKSSKIKIGDRFGRLTIIRDEGKYFTPKDGHRRKLFIVKCDCSTEFEARIDYLLRGDTTQCRDCRYNALTSVSIGETYDCLTVVSFIKQPSGKIIKKRAICNCICGNQISARPEQLKNGITRHCGCQQSPLWKGVGLISRTYFTRVKRGAKIRDLEFDITIDDIWELYQKQNGKCALTGLEIMLGKKSSDLSDASLDRIDSNLGYTKNNIQWVHKDIQKMKMDLPEERFIELCKLVSSQPH